MNGLCESLIRKMDDNKASKVLEKIIPKLENEDYEDLNAIIEAITYDRYLCQLYGIDYINVTKYWNKVKLASYYELKKTKNFLEVTSKQRKNIFIKEINGRRTAVIMVA